MSLDPRRRPPTQQAQQQQPPIPVPPPPPPPVAIAPAPAPVPTSTTPPKTDALPDTSFKLKFCTVCASNQNRSMEAHLQLASANLPTISFGTGSLVRLPGPTIDRPNVYHFNSTTYRAIHQELAAQDQRLYTANGLLNMLGRNLSIKSYPERFQDWIPGKPRLDHAEDQGAKGTESGVVDVIITCEERCFDAVLEDLHNKGGKLNRPVHVFNVDIKDNHEEALIGGKAIRDLALTLNEAAAKEREIHGNEGWNVGGGKARMGFDEKVPDILAEWQQRWPNLPALWSLAWF
ncbi:RNA polymerase II subunit A C-terminal domain phosphatase SSU72 [Westerdykella ornata]|uniref:RNA polymerase II subunit A C-terminal domain phosphatase SSU72 n=1 Tax=Westerdykella ornata TaxID=318751 RepID=A0A6A6JGL4_WESOR|nr:RNA polymerase II subunit A C-terminal domain phosphatase SSU72 [Westerdykella ornata]KAF2274359.1 RNA polymerase II subunit A C-terminal domain phosphatase SSU72 [Westerdykella ornata]